VRDLDIIDSELRLLAAVRRTSREIDGRVPSMTAGGCSAGRTRRANRVPVVSVPRLSHHSCVRRT
jgi:hypothetical protein